MSSPHAADTTWEPEPYLQFGAQRLRPALDLLSRVPLDSADRVVDLGCGTGSALEALRARFPRAELEGVDSSREMLEQAHQHCGQSASLARRLPSLQCRDIAAWADDAESGGQRYDLIFSNAALHWLPEHQLVLPRLVALLEPGGVLAIQMPRNWAEPSHALMRRVLKTLASTAAAEVLAQLQREPVASPDWYHDLLRDSCGALDVWETVYLHELAATGEGQQGAGHPVLEWVRSTALRPVTAALAADPAALELFLQRYATALRGAYGPVGTTPGSGSGESPVQRDATAGSRGAKRQRGMLFPFRRLFIVATRSSA